MITQSEYMRRMKEMANIQAVMSFYGEMPDMFNLVLNVDHKLVKQVLNDADNSCLLYTSLSDSTFWGDHGPKRYYLRQMKFAKLSF